MGRARVRVSMRLSMCLCLPVCTVCVWCTFNFLNHFLHLLIDERIRTPVEKKKSKRQTRTQTLTHTHTGTHNHASCLPPLTRVTHTQLHIHMNSLELFDLQDRLVKLSFEFLNFLFETLVLISAAHTRTHAGKYLYLGDKNGSYSPLIIYFLPTVCSP